MAPTNPVSLSSEFNFVKVSNIKVFLYKMNCAIENEQQKMDPSIRKEACALDPLQSFLCFLQQVASVEVIPF